MTQRGGIELTRLWRPLLWVLIMACGTSHLARADAYVGTRENIQSDTFNTGFNYFFGETVRFDDNLFRIPSGTPAPAGISTPNADNHDQIDSTTVGLNDQYVTERQILAVDISLAYDRYHNNGYLDNTSGLAHLLWDWTLTGRWSGQVGADHSRAIASFANTHVFAKDLIDTSGYFASFRFQVGPSWALTAEARHADASHSLETQRQANANTNGGTFGIEYATSEANTIGLQYRYSHGEYPNALSSPVSIPGNFNESTARAVFKYQPSDKTMINADAGYLQRDYVDPRLSTYAGDVWHASLIWEPGAKTKIVARLGRDLEAYVEAETEYFVSNERSISATWSPRSTLSLSAVLSWADLDFIAEPTFQGFYSARRDHLDGQSIVAAYTPRTWLSVNLGVTLQKRDSNVPDLSFDDTLISAGVKITL